MENKENELEIRSDEVKDIISYVPNWMIRVGNNLILFLVIIFFLALYLIQYPDTIVSEITITTALPPATIIAKSSGRIEEILISNNSLVSREQILAIIENTALWRDVERIKNEILDFHLLKRNTWLSDTVHNFKLGEVQESFSHFRESFKEYEFQIQSVPEIKELDIIETQIQEYKLLMKKQEEQLRLFKEEIEISSTEFARNEILFKNKVLSLKEFEEKKKDYLKTKRDLESVKIELSNNKITLTELYKSAAIIKIKGPRTTESLRRKVTESLGALKFEILKWEQKYVLKSSIAGKVTFFSFSNKNQNVKSGEEIFGIVPIQKASIFGKLITPVQNSGKITSGQEVNICLDAFPCEEWGMLKGSVKEISSIPFNGKYVVMVELVEGMRTSYNKNLDFKQEMHGEAKIITKKLRLIERIFYRLRKIVDN